MRESRTVTGLVTLVLVIAACGGSDSGEANADSAEPTVVEVVEEFFRVYESGDIEAWQALWAADATWEQTTTVGITYSGEFFGGEGLFDYGRRTAATDWDRDGEITISDIEARSVAEFYAAGGQWQADCAPLESNTVVCRVMPQTVFGVWAHANVQVADDSGAMTGTVTVTVGDGLVTHHAAEYAPLDPSVVTKYQDAQRDYWAWVQEKYSGSADQLIGSSQGKILFTPENYQQQRDLIAEWSAKS